MKIDIAELESTAKKIRGKVIEMSFQSGAAHLGSSLSCIDILVAIYGTAISIDPKDPDNPARDRFILSKGHAASALFATLAYNNFFPMEVLDGFGKAGSCLEEHPTPKCAPGVEAATGSLGHGLSLGIGIAISSRINKKPYRVFSILSDGECNEGSVWEAAMFAAGKKLENMISFVDFNKWQATGRSCEVMSLNPLHEKWESFGWSVYEVDGHDMSALVKILSNFPDGSGKPVAVIAHTVKGKGVSFMEDDNNWHYRVPNEQELISAKKELGLI